MKTLALTSLAGALVLAFSGAVQAQAGVFGSLANFDVVNDSGHSAWGFEIEIEDPLYDHPGMITSVFGLDRVFWMSPDPGYVVRYGAPTISYLPGFGARITYGGVLGVGASTPSAPFVTNGESCWPGANPNWQSTSCDHFGVSTLNSPAKTTYRWLLDNGAGGLTPTPVAVPALNIVYQPPVAGDPAPAPPVVVLQAQDLGGARQDNAFWVKVIKTTLEENVDLNDLLAGNHQGARPEIAGLESEVEMEWQPLQIGMVDEVTKVIDAPTPSVVYKFQFFRYAGRYDDDGYVDPLSDQAPQVDADGVAFVMLADGRHDLSFVGQQIAGFNANEVPAVPEPGTWALLLAGVAVVAARVRRSAPI